MNKKTLPKAIRREQAPDDAAATAAKEPAGRQPRQRPTVAAKRALSPEEVEARDRRARAVKVAQRFALWSGAAGLLPVPVVDLAAVGGVQIEMLRRISQIYGVPFSKSRGKALIAAIIGSMVPASSGMGASSVIKGVPGIGTVVSALAMPTLSVGATYAIGMAFIQHFAGGGTLLDFNPPDYKEFLKAEPRKSRPASQPA
jgi:uncharacterized protein (DUF697 family)